MQKQYSDRELAVLVLDSIEGFEYKHKKELLNHLSPQFLFENSIERKDTITKIVGERFANTILLALNKEFASLIINELNQKEVVAITYLDSEYPKSLKETRLFPLVLYCKGNTELLKSENLFGIVGSRKTLPYAEALATEISEKITFSGATVVSGCASGGDKAAILGAINNNKIISVLAFGHDYCYPDSSRDLIKKIENCGLVISEYPPKTQPRAWQFPIRNRIIAGLSKGVLIVSGNLTSGARHTMTFALDEGREVFAFPYSVGIKSGELCNESIKNGASLCDCAEDILSFLNLDKLVEKEKNELCGNEKLVFDAIKNGNDNASDIAKITSLKIFELAPILSFLELNGHIVKLMGNKFKAVK